MADKDPTPTPPPSPAFDKAGNRGFTHLVNAARFSLQGLAAAVRHEAAFRQELALAVILLPAAFLVGEGALEIALLIVSVFAVLVVELLNSAVESALDRIGLEHHPLTARAKDLGSAAVLLSLVATAILWLTLLWQNLLSGTAT